MAYGQLFDCNSCKGKKYMGSYWTVTNTMISQLQRIRFGIILKLMQVPLTKATLIVWLIESEP